MRKMIKFLMQLGIVEGTTFRTVHEEGVGMFIEPNPTPNRMQPNAVAMPTARRVDGNWTARPVYQTERFPFLK